MKKSVLISALSLVFVSGVSFAASMHSLNKEQIMSALQDKTMTTIPLLTLNDQLVNNTITMYFAKDGALNGQFATKPDTDPQSDQGKWEVKADGALCTTWNQINNKKPICVYVYKTSNSLIFINTDTNKFESMALNDNIKTGNQMK